MEKLETAIKNAILLHPDDHLPLTDYFDLLKSEKNHKSGSWLRDILVERIQNQELPVKHRVMVGELYEKSLKWDAPHDFDAFNLYLEYGQHPEQRFYMPRRHVLRRHGIIQAFQDIFDGELDLLSLSVPKRQGKTSLAIRFLLMMGGRNPEARSLAGGGVSSITRTVYSGFLEILQQIDRYKYFEIFPNVNLSYTNADDGTIHLNRKRRFATFTCRSIGASWVGSTEASPGGVVYLDDLVENDEVVRNRERMDNLFDAVRGDILGRRLEGVPIIIIGTRYSVHDPLGKLQSYVETMDWRAKIIEIPALTLDTDKSNWEVTIEGKKQYSTKFFRHERELVTEEQWEAQFQQNPFEMKGRLFPKDTLNYYLELPDAEPDAIIAACDVAGSGKDSTSLVIASIYNGDVYINDVVFDASPAAITKPKIVSALLRNNVISAVFESNSGGDLYADDCDRLIKEQKGRISIRKKRSISNKETRIEHSSDLIINTFYFKAAGSYPKQSSYGRFMQELTTYNRGGKRNLHDDAPDSLALLESEVKKLTHKSVEIFRRPF